MGKSVIFTIVMMTIGPCFLLGCWHPQYTDVTLSRDYNFSSFSGTVWSTKVNVAVADIKAYTGKHNLNLLSPRRFDPTVEDYAPVNGAKIIAVLPAGTRLRIERFIKDNGIGAADNVTGRLENSEYAQKIVYLDPLFLAKNRFIWKGESSSTNWNVNPDLLVSTEASGSPLQPQSSASNAVDAPRSGYEKGYENGKKQGTFVAQYSRPGTDFSQLSDPWLRSSDRRLWAVKIHGEDYVVQYELGYNKGFHDYSDKK